MSKMTEEQFKKNIGLLKESLSCCNDPFQIYESCKMYISNHNLIKQYDVRCCRNPDDGRSAVCIECDNFYEDRNGSYCKITGRLI